MKSLIIFCTFLFLSTTPLLSQFKTIEPGENSSSDPMLQRPQHQKLAMQPLVSYSFDELKSHNWSQPGLTGLKYNSDGLLTWIDIKSHLRHSSVEQLLNQIADQLHIKNPAQELHPGKSSEYRHRKHQRFTQTYKGIPVYGAEFILHSKNNQLYRANGLVFPTPQIESIVPSISTAEARTAIEQDLKDRQVALTIPDAYQHLTLEDEVQLVIYHVDNDPDSERLCYRIDISPNLTDRWRYFVDALDGQIIRAYPVGCKFHLSHETDGAHSCTEMSHHSPLAEAEAVLPPDGPTTANAIDLNGLNRTINTYEVNSGFYLIDGSRSMFNPTASSLPNDPVGAIWTITASGTSPQNDNFQASHVFSNNNVWNDPVSVSAHYNAAISYEYFLSTFGRNSINGNGGNIISIIDVRDQNNAEMDNAFWNGAAMWYGNGNQIFSELAGSLDVGGHEMSHGVIQTTANLEYVSQSGAMNEAFADIFGAMIDRDDWQMGEDVVISNQYPSGALRDLSNPNQNLNGPGDISRGWQPDHMDEFVNLRPVPEEDNGGVHINSGIPNHAFYLYAEAVGKSDAEQVFYRALNDYLTKSSQFGDLRFATISAAEDLFGSGSTQVAEVMNAMDAVGITDNGSGGEGPGDVETNPGDEYILCTDNAQDQLYIYNYATGEFLFLPVIVNGQPVQGPISKPSISDDGTDVIYVAEDKTVRELIIDYDTETVQEFIIGAEPEWRSAVLSKDGSRIAALLDELDNEILIFDFSTDDVLQERYELYNPTFSDDPEAVTGDVDFADAMEFDFTGENLMYDAQNTIKSQFGSDIVYWDIGFLNVWNNEEEGFGSGRISKLFTQIPENISIGNPTFSKNSPFIVAFDLYDSEAQSYGLLAANIETGDVNQILTNDILSYPNYSTDDQLLAFDVNDPGEGRKIRAIELNEDKITAGNTITDILVGGAKWTTWYANGERQLTSTRDINQSGYWQVAPTISESAILLTFEKNFKIEDLSLTSLDGKKVWSKRYSAQPLEQEFISIADLVPGQYLLQARGTELTLSTWIIKL